MTLIKHTYICTISCKDMKVNLSIFFNFFFFGKKVQKYTVEKWLYAQKNHFKEKSNI